MADKQKCNGSRSGIDNIDEKCNIISSEYDIQVKF